MLVPVWTHEPDLLTDLQRFGEVRDLKTISFSYGINLVNFYDPRAAKTLLMLFLTTTTPLAFFSSLDISPSSPPFTGVPLWTHLVIFDLESQTTLVAFNKPPHTFLQQVFQSYDIILNGKILTRRLVGLYGELIASKSSMESLS